MSIKDIFLVILNDLEKDELFSIYDCGSWLVKENIKLELYFNFYIKINLIWNKGLNLKYEIIKY